MNHFTLTSRSARYTSTCLGLFLALCTVAPAPAQKVARPDQARPKLVLEAGEHRLSDLIDRTARYLKRNYLYDDREMKQASSFRLHTGVAMDAEQCEDFVSQIAFTKDFAMVPVNRSLKVFEFINLRGQHRGRIFAESITMTPEQVKKIAKRHVGVTTSFTFKHIDAARASQQLRPFFAASAGAGAHMCFVALTSKSLIMTGFASQVARAMELLEMVDTPEPVKQAGAKGSR